MATTTLPERLKSTLKVTQHDFDPDATTITAVGWVDMRDYGAILIGLRRTIGTSAMTVFAIHANTTAAGDGDDVAVITKVVTTADAVEDEVYIECGIEQIMQLAAENGKAYRYVSLKLAFATGTDEASVTYIQGEADHKTAGLTADIIA